MTRNRGSGDGHELTQSAELLALVFEYAPDATLLVDRNGLILKANAQAEHLFGYGPTELVSKPIEILVPDRFVGRHVTYRTGYMSAPRLRPMGAGVDLHARRKDGTEVPVDILLNTLDTSQGPLALAVVRDITERKHAEEQIRASLREKDMLLHEIHHRVKNNLAVIGSSFYLQSTYTSDQHTVQALQDCQNRVRSMALVHERLYHSGDFASVDFAQYAKELAMGLLPNYALQPEAIELKLELDPVVVSLDRAVPCALILNELVSNALKHGFPNGRTGTLTLSLRHTTAGGCRLSVIDDGVGMPEDTELATRRTFGMRLLTSLVKQLDGKLEWIRRSPGTEARITLEQADAPSR